MKSLTTLWKIVFAKNATRILGDFAFVSFSHNRMYHGHMRSTAPDQIKLLTNNVQP